MSKPKIKRKVLHVPSVWDGHCLSIKLEVKKEKDHSHASPGAVWYDFLCFFKEDLLFGVEKLLRVYLDSILLQQSREALKGKKHDLREVVEKLKIFPRGRRKK